MTKSNNFYNGPVNWNDTGFYYIHEHQEHIGKAQPGNITGESAITHRFNQLKKQNASNAIKRQYKAVFLNNIQDEDVANVSQLFNDNSSDAILKKINDAMKQELQERINTEKIAEAIQAEKDIKWDQNALNKAIKDNNALEALETLDSILTQLEKGVKMINYKGGDIAKVLSAARKGLSDMKTSKTPFSLQSFGSQLKQALAKEEEKWVSKSKNSKAVTLTQEQILSAIGELKKFSARLETLKKGGSLHNNKKDEDLTADALKSFVEKNLFSTLIGETIPTHMKQVANRTSFLTIKKTLESIRGTGKDTMELQPQTEEGSFDPTQSRWDQPRQIKTDIRFNNVQVDLSQILGPEYGSITMGFGISNKAYKTGSFGGDSVDNFGTKTFNAGGGMNIEHGLAMLTSNTYLQYLAYNVFAREQTMGSALIAVQNALFTRSIVYLFGSRNIKDFANFMLINGHFVSLWDIISYAVNYNIGVSRSHASQEQGIMVSIDKEDRQQFGAYLNAKDSVRMEETNKAIRKAGLHAYIRPAQLAKAVQKL